MDAGGTLQPRARGRREPFGAQDPEIASPKAEKRRRKGAAAFFEWFYDWLERPVHASTLCTFRALYSLVMLTQLAKWSTMFTHFQTTVYALHYPGIGWIKPVSPAIGDAILTIGFVANFFLFLGFLTRAASVVCFLVFAYLFHLCASHYNNHYILMCHVCFLGCFVNWNVWLAVDRLLPCLNKRKKNAPTTIPNWHLLLFRLIFSIPYFFGSIAKMNWDWVFRAQPLIDWFSGNGGLYDFWLFPWFIAETGLVFDLVISFLLFWKRTRYIIGFPAAVFFNISNKIMFDIGVFPVAMICSLVLFLEPHWPAAVIAEAAGNPPPNKCAQKTEENGKEGAEFSIMSWNLSEKKSKDLRRWFVLVFVCSFLAFHALYPLRHFVLYKSNPSWTEEGHIGAWHMKLRSKEGWVQLITEEENGRVLEFIPNEDPYVTRIQLRKINTWPHTLLMYVARMKKLFVEAGRHVKSIRAKSCFSLNMNPSKELYISDANLLDYIDTYEIIGTTGVDKWIYTAEGAPPCSQDADPQAKNVTKQRSREAYMELYKDAHIKQVVQLDYWGEPKRRVVHETISPVSGQTIVEPAYTWNI